MAGSFYVGVRSAWMSKLNDASFPYFGVLMVAGSTSEPLSTTATGSMPSLRKLGSLDDGRYTRRPELFASSISLAVVYLPLERFVTEGMGDGERRPTEEAS